MADRLRVTELDFDTIKQNLKTFLNQQSEFTDYDFEGSGLSVLLDILAYNTHYNAYYLNMVANESFLDTALLRDSVVSHAKILGYVPYSRKAAEAVINFTAQADSSNTATLTIPKGYRFLSNDIDDISYNFVTLNETTVTKANSKFLFSNLKIYEGQLASYSFVQTNLSNPNQIFTLPDSNIDTTTLSVSVQPSSTNTNIDVYSLATDIANASSQSLVFYLQENKSQKYSIYFGNDIIGKKIPDGSIVNVNYLITNGDAANKANNFVATNTLTDSLGNSLTNFIINPIFSASGGSERESVEEIKFSAPLQFTTQNRLVTTKDYESFIKKNYPSIDSLSVWGGEDEVPRVYGKVFISLKPKENFFLSQSEKQRILSEIVGPKSVISVSAEIRDPEYIYLILNNQVKYDPKKTVLTETQISTLIRSTIINYKQTFLNKFGAVFALSKLQDRIDGVETNSIVGSETILKLQKRIEPTFGVNSNYTIDFATSIKRGTVADKLTTSEFYTFDGTGQQRLAIIEEIPQSFSGISSIEVLNAGYGYKSVPTVTIFGDGTGATAEAIVEGEKIVGIRMINRGVDYTRATVSITGGSGFSALAFPVIDSKVGTLRTIYYDENANRQIISPNIGEINYDTGKITINDLNIVQMPNLDGLLRFTATSEDKVIESAKNSIITIDENDVTSIVTTFEKITL